MGNYPVMPDDNAEVGLSRSGIRALFSRTYLSLRGDTIGLDGNAFSASKIKKNTVLNSHYGSLSVLITVSLPMRSLHVVVEVGSRGLRNFRIK